MTELKLKEEYKGLVITKLYPGVGYITFDTDKVLQSQYKNFLPYGFDHIFDVENEIVTELPTVENPVVVKRMNTKKNGRPKK